jgi:hypothetical protein
MEKLKSAANGHFAAGIEPGAVTGVLGMCLVSSLTSRIISGWGALTPPFQESRPLIGDYQFRLSCSILRATTFLPTCWFFVHACIPRTISLYILHLFLLDSALHLFNNLGKMATNTIFSNLPTEVLQRFALFLPPKDVLNLVLTCRKAHNACDNLVTWRQIIRLNSWFPSEISLSEKSSREAWKRLAVVDAKASSDYQNDSLTWLPQAMALHRKSLHHLYVISRDTNMNRGTRPSLYHCGRRRALSNF